MLKIQMLKIVKMLFVSGLIICILIGGAGCKKAQPTDGDADDDEFSPVSGTTISEEAAKELNDKIQIIAYFVSEDGTKLNGEVRYMELEEAKQSTENIASAIVNELLKGPSEGFTGKKVIPDGTKLLAPVTINGSLAVVNLSSEFIEGSTGIKKDVEMSIYSLVNSVTEIKELDRVKILIDGKEQASFKGILEMNMPFKRNKSLISVNQVAAKDTAADVESEDDDDVLLE